MRKLTALALGLLLTFFFTGCGGNPSLPTKSGSGDITRDLKEGKIHLGGRINDFVLSTDGSKSFLISNSVLNILDMKSYVLLGKLEIELPDNSSLELDKPNQILKGINISPNEKKAYITTYDPRHGGDLGSLLILDIGKPRNPKLISTTKNLGDFFYAKAKVLPDGKHLLVVTSHTDFAVINIEDSKKPRIIGSIRKAELSLDDIEDIALSPDGKRAYIAGAVTRIINLEDLSLPRVISSIHLNGGVEFESVDVSKDQKRLYISDDERNLRIYNIENEANPYLISIHSFSESRSVEAVFLSYDDKRLYVASMDERNDEHRRRSSLTIFDSSNRDELTIIKKVQKNSFIFVNKSFALSPDGRKLYANGVVLNIIDL